MLADLFAPVDGARLDRDDVAVRHARPGTSRPTSTRPSPSRCDGDDVVLHYAIADVGWFVDPGDAIDQEAWRRGVTDLPARRPLQLVPTGAAEGAASLLPDGPRRRSCSRVRVAADGAVALDGVERAVIRSRAKLAYDDGRRSPTAAGVRRAGPSHRAGRGGPRRRPRRVARAGGDPARAAAATLALPAAARDRGRQNAALSLATNLAVADRAARGADRAVPGDGRASTTRQLRRLRHTARRSGSTGRRRAARATSSARSPTTTRAPRRSCSPCAAPAAAPLRALPRGAWCRGTRRSPPPTCHATAPLRRLADRYVIEAALAVGQRRRRCREPLVDAFDAAARGDGAGRQLANRVDRAALDLAEAVVLHGREGEVFDAVVIDEDERGVQFQLADPAVVARVCGPPGRPRRRDPGAPGARRPAHPQRRVRPRRLNSALR